MPDLHAYAECASTNDVARALAADGAAHGTVVVADHQSAGRGRHGRAWADRPGASLLLSMVLRPARDADPAAASALPLLVGLAAARALRAATALDVKLEWPNDLVVDDRKVGGILCESALGGGRLDFVVAGLGINVAALPADLDPATRARAASVADLLGAGAPSRAPLAGEIVRRLVALAADAPLEGADLDQLRTLDSLAGRPVRFGAGREGIARGILPDGALAVEADGATIQVRSGSVTPAGPRILD
ncbi:MAG TPA: biotin--[acetyl-CoA-carboxylase] ligase [Longimicrobiales bacterium]